MPSNLVFSVARSSSGLIRRSIVNQHSSGTTLKFVPPPLSPPSISMELGACSELILNLVVRCSTSHFSSCSFQQERASVQKRFRPDVATHVRSLTKHPHPQGNRATIRVPHHAARRFRQQHAD